MTQAYNLLSILHIILITLLCIPLAFYFTEKGLLYRATRLKDDNDSKKLNALLTAMHQSGALADVKKRNPRENQ